MDAYMYLLECSDGTFYCGSTTDLAKRITEHEQGIGSKYTKNRLPVKLIYSEWFDRIDSAFYREKQIQGWSRQKKIALIRGELNQLPKLSKKSFEDE